MTAAIASAGAHLFAPRVTYRLPRNTNTDTPLPPEEPAGKNPPDGAILYYYLQLRGAMSRIDIVDSERQECWRASRARTGRGRSTRS